ncbi:MAG TPA: hypothetical protein VF664_18310 [Cystobacter sp.]|jgi:hypothetical protein
MKLVPPLLLSCLMLVSACERTASPGDADAGTLTDGGAGSPPPPGEPIPDAGTSVNAPRFEHYIRRQPYPRMVLEVDGWGGYTPTASVAEKLRQGLLGLLDKESIEVRVDQAFPGKGADHAWANDELLRLAEQTGTLEVASGTIKLHVLLVDGHSAMDTNEGKVLGLAFPWTHLVLFRQTMDTLCNRGSPLNQCARAELGVWAHEVGHQLGLVDNGLAMSRAHKDAEHGAHDSSDQCVMYWAYESSAGLEALLSGLLGDQANLGFDAACLADLNAVKTRP